MARLRRACSSRRVGWNGYALGPQLGALTPEDRSRVDRARAGRGSLDPSEAAILFMIVVGLEQEFAQIPESHRSGVERLLRRRLATQTSSGRLVPSGDFVYSLGLDVQSDGLPDAHSH